MNCIDVKTVTRRNGNAVNWALGSCKSLVIFTSYNEFINVCCPAPGSYELTCHGSYGEGWYGGYVEIQGKKYCEGFSGGYVKKEQVTITGSSTLPYG